MSELWRGHLYYNEVPGYDVEPRHRRNARKVYAALLSRLDSTSYLCGQRPSCSACSASKTLAVASNDITLQGIRPFATASPDVGSFTHCIRQLLLLALRLYYVLPFVEYLHSNLDSAIYHSSCRRCICGLRCFRQVYKRHFETGCKPNQAGYSPGRQPRAFLPFAMFSDTLKLVARKDADVPPPLDLDIQQVYVLSRMV